MKQVTWHGKGDYLASVVADHSNMQVLIHQTSKRWSQNPFRKSKGLVQCVLFHPIRPYFFVATQRYVRVYNLLKQELTKKLMTNCKWVSSMAIHPGGTWPVRDPGSCRGAGRTPQGSLVTPITPCSLSQATTSSVAATTVSWPGLTWTSPPDPTSCCGEPQGQLPVNTPTAPRDPTGPRPRTQQQDGAQQGCARSSPACWCRPALVCQGGGH